jgi:hypothetical protein
MCCPYYQIFLHSDQEGIDYILSECSYAKKKAVKHFAIRQNWCFGQFYHSKIDFWHSFCTYINKFGLFIYME